MIIETEIDSKMYMKLMFTLAYRKPVTIIFTSIGFILLLLSALYFMGFNSIFNEPPHLQLVLGFFIVAFLPFSVYRSAKNNYASLGRLREKIIYEFTDEKIVETGETFDSEMDWTEMNEVVELKDWIIIYHESGSANFIPKKSFEKNLNEFKDIVKCTNIAAIWK